MLKDIELRPGDVLCVRGDMPVVSAGIRLVEWFLSKDGEAVTAARAQVAIIADSLRAATGSDSNIIVYGAVAVYVGRKLEKIVSVWKGAKDN